MSSIEIYSLNYYNITAIDFSTGGFYKSKAIDYNAWFLGALRLDLYVPEGGQPHYSNFPYCFTENDWRIIIEALLKVAKQTGAIFVVHYNNKKYGVDAAGLWSIVSYWEPISFLPPVSETTEEETGMYNEYIAPVWAECPQCHCTATDEDDCFAGSELRDHIEDHGMCPDCLERWQYECTYCFNIAPENRWASQCPICEAPGNPDHDTRLAGAYDDYCEEMG